MKQESWGTRIGLVLAMAGNAVGLGNFLRFPMKAVQNGGAEYIIPYIVCFLLMGIPLLLVEWAIGRYGGSFGHHSTPFVMHELGNKKFFWKYIGVFGLFTNFGVMAYYTYIESWTLGYAFKSIQGFFLGYKMEEVRDYFYKYVGVSQGIIDFSSESFIFFILTLLVNTYILSRGLAKGVEIASLFGMPLLILFAIFLAIRALTIGKVGDCETCASVYALNYLWTPNLSGILNFKTWLEAAGQIFFTLSVGMGTIQCYASYLKRNKDIALNALSAGFTNEFVEIVLGSSIVIPLCTAYFGLDWTTQNSGFMMGFQVLPYLFGQWGYFLSAIAGFAWFFLLFLAGLTSSLAMGTPWVGFMRDEFGWSTRKSAISFGIITFILALPPILFFSKGVFDEYDFWTGTFSLVIFAMLETFAFGWIFGIHKGWDEVTAGAEIKLPTVIKYVMKYITPIFLFIVFLGSLIRPEHDDWAGAFNALTTGKGWPLHHESIIGMILGLGFTGKDAYFFYDGIPTKKFFATIARIILIALFVILCFLVWIAYKKKQKALNNNLPLNGS